MDFNFHTNLLLWFAIIWTTFLLHFIHPTPTPAAAYRERYVEEKCKDTQTGRELFIGESYTRLGECVRVQCLGDLNIWEDRCQVPQLNGNCTQTPVTNKYLDYPRCCPTYECRRRVVNVDGQTEEINTYDHYGNMKKSRIRQVIIIPGSIQVTADNEPRIIKLGVN